MVAFFRHSHARINFLFRVAVLGFSAAAYFVGVALLLFGTLATALHMTYRWLRDGVWHSYTLADVLSGHGEGFRPPPEDWLHDIPLLISMPMVGGTLTVVGMMVLFGVGIGVAVAALV